MTWIRIIIFSILITFVACTSGKEARSTNPNKKDDANNRDKRNLEYDISHASYQSYARDGRLERRISNIPPPLRMYPAFFPSGTRPYTYYRKQKPQLPPYAVQMEPLAQYSQRDPLYDPTSLSSLPQPHNELIIKPDDQSTDNNHLSENYYGPAKHQYIDRPVYIKEPEPIIEIIIKEANTTAAPHHQELVTLPPKKKKEEVQVFYVKYKKNPHGTGKDSVIYDKPIPALSPIQDQHDEHEELQHEPPHLEYAGPTYSPPVSTTTIRAIIKPDSETYHADTGIHVTFGGASHNPHAETYSHDDDIVESAPQPAVSHPEGRRFPNNNINSPTTTTFTQEYKPEQRLPQPYRPFNFNTPQHNVNQRPPQSFQQQQQPTFNNNHNGFNAPSPALSNAQIFNNPVPNRFASGTFQNSRPPFGAPLKQQGPKPYQFERPQAFQFPARPQTHFPIHQQQQQAQQQQLPVSQPPVVFNHKPSFSSKFPQQQQQHNFGQQQQQQHQITQQVLHQGPNSFSFQTHFAEPTLTGGVFNQGFQGHQGQGNNQQFHHQQQSAQQPTYQTIRHNQLQQPQQQPQQQQQQFNQQQHQHQQPQQHFSQGQQHQQQQKPLQQQQQPNIHPAVQSLPLVQNFNQQPFNSQFTNNHNFQFGQQQQQQQQQQLSLSQHQRFLPPGGELIAALPKFEQHISIPSAPEASLEQFNQQQNYTNQIQQQFRDFAPQEIQQHQPSSSINTNSNIQNHNFDFNSNSQNPSQNYYKFSTATESTPTSYVTSPKPSSTTRLLTTTRTTTTTTTPKPESTTFNLKDLNIELPDEVPDDLREQLLSSGILKNAQISVLDYDKVGDIPISALPPDQLANFYSAGGAQQIASASIARPAILRPDGSSIRNTGRLDDTDVDEEDNMEPTAEASDVSEVRVANQPVEMKVVRYNPASEQGQQLHDAYVKQDSTQIEPVVLNDQSYNRYLPLKVSGAKFPIPEVPELRGKNINSVVVLAPVDYNFYKQRVVRDAKAKVTDDIQLIKNDALKKLVKEPSLKNYEDFLDNEKKTVSAQQSVILLVTGEPTNREIFMYDVSTKSVSKLDGELSAAFVDAAESNTSEAQEEEHPDASNLIETKVPVPEDFKASSYDKDFDELQPEASDIYETRVPIIDPMQTDLDAEGSEQLEQFVDVSGLQHSGNDDDLIPAASEGASETILINSGYSKTEYQMPSH